MGMGATRNRDSLFALIFSIGILVDDAIVVVENIHRWQDLSPAKPLLEIITCAVNEVGGPTMALIDALLPMACVTGLMGSYMSPIPIPIPINSSMGMIISLAVAIVVTPWFAARLMKSHAATPSAPVAQHQSGKLEAVFRRLLTPFLARRKLLLTISLIFGIFVSTLLTLVVIPELNLSAFNQESAS